MLERVGIEPVTGQELWLLEIGEPRELPPEMGLPPSALLCLLAWDSSEASVKEIDFVAQRLLDWGACYVCCWGPGCERVHDIIDEVAVMAQIEDAAADADVVMTTWHDREPLEEALEFLVCNAQPEVWRRETRCARLAVTMGSSAWSAAARAFLRALGGGDGA